MIRRIYSSLRSFKTLDLRPGLNVLISKKEAGATEKQTRNRAGKTSLIEIVHFLLGADADKRSLFQTKALAKESFGMIFQLGGEEIRVERAAADKGKVRLLGAGTTAESLELSSPEWLKFLGERMFQLDKARGCDGRPPTFRSLVSYFARRQSSSGFSSPEKNSAMQQTGDYQTALLYLLGLDWTISSEWQRIRDEEKSLKQLRRAARDGALGRVVGKTADLRTQHAVAEARLMALRSEIGQFRVLPQYSDLEKEADELTFALNSISNANVIDVAAIRDLELAMEAETPPRVPDLRAIFDEAGIVLPEIAIKRYEDVRKFHESVISNRRDYLSAEHEAAKERLALREEERKRLDKRRAEIVGILNTHGALDQLSALQGELARAEAIVEGLRQRFETAKKLEEAKPRLGIERNKLTLRLRHNFGEQEIRLKEAILAFEKTSEQLYESAGSMTVEPTANGPAFEFQMQGSRSKGIKNMQIFCFDMMLMRVCTSRGMGPGFLIHDSHLFDGVDGRQVISALKVGSETAEELGFQYIVTMNEDDAFKESLQGFDLRDHVLPTVLTDAEDDGGLFGIRF